MSDSQHPSGSFFPSPPPVRPDVTEYVKAFDKPLTMDEKTAWLAEITHLVLQGVLPQEVYPALKDKIESLPTITPAKDRPDEKLPGSDYVYPGPPKPLTATTTVFPNAMPLHEYEHRKTTSQRKRQKPDSSFVVRLFVFGVFVLGFIAYGIGTWTMNNTKLIRETPQQPAMSVSNDDKFVGNTQKRDNPLENPFEDASLTKDMEAEPENSLADLQAQERVMVGEELLRYTDFDPAFDFDSNNKSSKNKFFGGSLRDSETSVATKNGILTVECQKRGTDHWVPHIIWREIGLKKGVAYRILYEIKAARPASLVCAISTNIPPFTRLCDVEEMIHPEWKTYTFDFIPEADSPEARLTFHGFQEKCPYEFRKISLRRTVPVENPFENPALAKEPETKFGRELIRMSIFSDGYQPRWRDHDWHWQQQYQGRQFGTAEGRNGVLRIDVRQSAGRGLPQLFYSPFPLEKGKKYRVEIEIRSEKSANLQMAANAESPTWHRFVSWKIQIDKDWQTIRHDFTANESRDLARLHFSEFEAENIYELRKVSVREILP